MFRTVLEGNKSSGINLLSGFGEAIGSPFKVVVLYRSPNPRTISCPALAIEIPVIFFTPSCTLLMPFTLISFAPRFSIATVAFWRSMLNARSPSRFLRATTETSLKACASLSISKFSTTSLPLAFTVPALISVYPTYFTTRSYTPPGTSKI